MWPRRPCRKRPRWARRWWKWETGLQRCEQGQTVYFADTLKETAAFVEKLAVINWRSAVAVPLMVEGKLFGVLVSTKGKRGTGLGLAMVYGVMERHEGNIDIQSEPGKGTTIRLVFPVRTKLYEDIEEKDTLTAIEPLQILCIDDEPLLRELIKEILERDGHEVEVSDSGQSGLDEFRIARERGRPFDVVITDLGMPYLDGRQVAKALKQESPTTPVIMLTGWGAFIKEDGNTPEQVDGVISKPPRSRELREALSRFHPIRGNSTRH